MMQYHNQFPMTATEHMQAECDRMVRQYREIERALEHVAARDADRLSGLGLGMGIDYDALRREQERSPYWDINIAYVHPML
jgi:hypothetical protein